MIANSTRSCSVTLNQTLPTTLSPESKPVNHQVVFIQTSESSMDKLVSEHQDNRSSASHPNWRMLWKTIKQIIKGELKLQWVHSGKHPTVEDPRREGRRSDRAYRDVPPLSSNNGRSPLSAEPVTESIAPPSLSGKTPWLAVHCLGLFHVYQNDQLLEKWPDNKATLIFKYMVTHRQQPIHLEVLVDLFWPGVDSQAGRKNCYQAIYTLRKMLQASRPDFDHILCDNSCYYFNPELTIWVDSEAFLAAYQAGQKLEQAGQVEDPRSEAYRVEQAIEQYQLAKSLYKGHFLAKDIYEDWPINQRERLKFIHLDILDRLSQYYFKQEAFAMCIDLCHKLLGEDNCREDAHRRLMRCYLLQGQRHLALRQYQLCIETLQRELDVPPMPATSELYQQILENPNLV